MLGHYEQNGRSNREDERRTRVWVHDSVFGVVKSSIATFHRDRMVNVPLTTDAVSRVRFGVSLNTALADAQTLTLMSDRQSKSTSPFPKSPPSIQLP